MKQNSSYVCLSEQTAQQRAFTEGCGGIHALIAYMYPDKVNVKLSILPTLILTIRASMAASRSRICLLISCFPSFSPATTSVKRSILFFRLRTLTNPSILNHTQIRVGKNNQHVCFEVFAFKGVMMLHKVWFIYFKTSGENGRSRGREMQYMIVESRCKNSGSYTSHNATVLCIPISNFPLNINLSVTEHRNTGLSRTMKSPYRFT